MPDSETRSTIGMSAAEAALSERVSHQGRRMSDLELEMRSGFNQINSSVSTLGNETRQALATLSTNLADRNKPQWQALGVLLTAMVVLGGLAYWPIRESTTRIDATLTRLSEVMVTRDELKTRADRSAEDRLRTDRDIRDMQSVIVTRNEWTERNLARDHDIENLRENSVREITNLQRQIDNERGDFQTFSNSLGNGRDFIQDLKEEVNRLSDQLADLRAKYYTGTGTMRP